jgi:hypothetical protein
MISFNRMRYGTSKLICEYIEKGEAYSKAKGLDKAQKTLDIMKLKDEDRRAYNRKLENVSLEKSLARSREIEGLN